MMTFERVKIGHILRWPAPGLTASPLQAAARALPCLSPSATLIVPEADAQAQTDREALLAAMGSDPTDLEPMFAYAAASVQEHDLEAAIAALERLRIFNPDLPRVRLEPGAACCRLGAHDVARLHFEGVPTADPPEEVRQSVAPSLAQIDRRSASGRFTGFVGAGLVCGSNANRGPREREVLVTDFPNGLGTLSDDAAVAVGFGYRIGAGSTHRPDMQRPTEPGAGLFVSRDNTALTAWQNGDIVLDRYVYDPDAASGNMAPTVSYGIVHFIGGEISKDRDVEVRIPDAVIAIVGERAPSP
jgi:hypothetical protein